MTSTGRKGKNSFFKGLVKSFFAVVILTAFVFGLSFFVKSLYSLDYETALELADPVLSKLGLSQDEAGDVAGEFARRLSQTGVKQNKTLSQSTQVAKENNGKTLFTVAILADSHDDTKNLETALQVAKEKKVDVVVHLGDLTNYGDVEHLQTARDALDAVGLQWYAIPGDHDLAQSVGLENFLQVFDKNYFKTELNGQQILVMDNSANFTPLDEERFTWFLKEVKSADFVFLSQPIYHPTNPAVMGQVNDEKIEDVSNQAKILLNELQNSQVKAVFAGDHHLSTENRDLVRSDLMHIVVGALVTERNFQTPRFSLLTVYENGNYIVDEIVL